MYRLPPLKQRRTLYLAPHHWDQLDALAARRGERAINLVRALVVEFLSDNAIAP